MDNATVKLDSELLRRIKKLIQKSEWRIRYTNLKQFVNIAILKLLEEELQRESKNSPKKKGGVRR